MKRAILLLLLLACTPASVADHHGWLISEVFSNSDGSLQFFEMQTTTADAGHPNISCCPVTSSDSGGPKVYTFPTALTGDTANRKLLAATANFEGTYGIRPDYIIPDNFLANGAGSLSFVNTVQWSSLPTDGVNSLNVTGSTTTVGAATPANYSGQTVTLADTVRPIIANVPGTLTISSNSAISGTAAEVTNHFSAVSCSDAVDTSPTLNLNVPGSFAPGTTTDVTITCIDDAQNTQSATVTVTVTTFTDTDGDGIADETDTDDDGDGVIDTDDAFPLDASESIDTDGDEIGNNADTDDDGDGVADADDAFPLDASESVDSDGDGIGNNADTDDDNDGIPDAEDDDIPPTISLTSPVRVDAAGRKTEVDLGEVSATDDKSTTVSLSSDQPAAFDSGRHIVTWTATDEAGNTTTREQVVEIRPHVSLQLDQTVTEGSTAIVEVRLLGPPVGYPVVITYSTGGTAIAGSDFTELPGAVTLAGGLTAAIELSLITDDQAEADETVTLTITDADGAVPRGHLTHTVTITEENVAPAVSVEAQQGGQRRFTVYRDGGPVTITGRARDPNQDQTPTYDWSASSTSLALSSTSTAVTTFDPAAVPAGTYRVELVVSDGIDTTIVRRRIHVEASAAILSDSVDTDSDGVADANEGRGDNDGDGIPDYLDTSDDTSLLPATATATLQTDPGLRLRLGETAIASGKQAAAISVDNLNALLDDNQAPPDNTFDPGFRYPEGLTDFEVDQLPESGQQVRVVIPLENPVPAGATWRKYAALSGWSGFVTDADNDVASAGQVANSCPPPRDERFASGLAEGDRCIQLTIVDGGPNDTDGVVNRIVRDPGGLAVVDEPPELNAPAGIRVEAVDAGGAPVTDETVAAFLAAGTCADTPDGDLTVTVSAPGLDLSSATTKLPIGDTSVTFACADSTSSAVSSASNIAVVDTTDPVLEVPGQLTIESEIAVSTNDSRIAEFIAGASCADSVSGSLPVANDLPAWLSPGSNTVTFSCTDDAGNTASRAASVSIQAPPAPVNASDKGAGCFIATAAYGSYLDPHVEMLRDFRDHHLLTNAIGRRFVAHYYALSPPIADLIAGHGALRAVVRTLLTPLVYTIAHPGVAVAAIILIGLTLLRRKKRIS